MTLREYINEAGGVYNNLITGPNWLEELYKAKKPPRELQKQIQHFIESIFGGNAVRLTWSMTATEVKIPHAYERNVIDYCKKYEDFEAKRISGKIHIFIWGNRLFLMGNGSVGRVYTHEQEEATCIVWNNWEKGMEPDANDMGYLGLKDTSWYKAFEVQVKTIAEAIGRGYTAERYGFGTVGKTYAGMIQSLIKQVRQETGEKYHKDTIDPTDIVLYKDSSVIKDLKELTKQWDPARYMELFTSRRIVGISLKKAVGEYKFMNTEKTELVIKSVGDPVRTKGRNGNEGRGASVIVDTNMGKYKVVFRSFNISSNQVGMDILKDGPSLGKVPVWYWRDHAGLSTDLQTGINDFTELCKSNKAKVHMKKFIELGAKLNSPVPYLLIK